MALTLKIRTCAFGLGLLATLAASACGGGGDHQPSGTTGGGGDTTTSSTSTTSNPGGGGGANTGAVVPCGQDNIAGTWALEGTKAGTLAAVTFDSNGGTYTLGGYAEVSSAFYEAEEIGTYKVAIIGGEAILTVTPQHSTCPLGAPRSYACLVGGGFLALSMNGTNSLWAQYTTPLPSNAELGCGETGTWVPSQLMP